MLRKKYRKEFGLTSYEMDREPNREVRKMEYVFAAEFKRSKKDNKSPKSGSGGSKSHAKGGKRRK